MSAALQSMPRQGGRVSVAVQKLETSDQALYGDQAYDTASIVKVDILAALLLQAQEARRSLAAQERAYATAMIKISDNVATTALWRAIGGAAGLDAVNKRLGLTETMAGKNGNWGLTQTTAKDQLRLLQQVFGSDAVLSKAARDYIQELMGDVADGQDWGISTAGSHTALKNGWLPRSTTGMWDVNSIGRVRVDRQDYLIAVLSDGNRTQAEGIARIEAAARAVASAIHAPP
ncbi:serine hydrolase [Streptomyces sp. NPDC002659]|uniref:serine hydrolase n=1 Tax=Streptomyces sp. NPDC002659 TaxID=3364656 RepID=UPI003690F0DC